MKGFKVMSIISIICGTLTIIGGIVAAVICSLLGSDIKSALDNNTGGAGSIGAGFALIFGGFVWLALVLLIGCLFITGIFLLLSGILGLDSIKKSKKSGAISAIVFNSIIIFFNLPEIFNPIGILLLSVPVLNLVFCVIYLKELKKRDALIYESREY